MNLVGDWSGDFVYWCVHAPMSQLYLAMFFALMLVILILSPNITRALKMGKRSYRRTSKFRSCLNCGRRPRGNGKSEYCSEKCERRFYTKQVRANYAGRKWHKNRLFQQSNICGICNQPITNMKEATIDHIIPLSKGGIDDITNMQLAHSDCNQLKGNLMPGDIVEPTGEGNAIFV